jgi:hypothetical protein
MESPAKPGFLSDSSPALRNLKAPKHKARDTFRFHLVQGTVQRFEKFYQRCLQRK